MGPKLPLTVSELKLTLMATYMPDKWNLYAGNGNLDQGVSDWLKVSP